MSVNPKIASSALCFGDLVFLRLNWASIASDVDQSTSVESAQSVGLVCSSGGFDTSVLAIEKNQLKHVEDCVFVVLPQLQYSRQKQMDKVSSQRKLLRRSSTIDDGLIDFLKVTTERERQANETLISKSLGQMVTYGSVVVLKHLQSGKFLTASSRLLSRVEGDCLVTHLSDGSEASWWSIKPRFKIRSEGEPVVNGDELRFFNMKTKTFFHISRDPLPEGAVLRDINTYDDSQLVAREANCSAESATDVSIKVFSSYSDENDKFISFGEVVTLHHPESELFLSLNEGEMTPTLLTKAGAMGLFRVESAEQMNGGCLEWGQRFRLRHLVTGQLLCMRKSDFSLVIDDQGPDVHTGVGLLRAAGTDFASKGPQSLGIVFESTSNLTFGSAANPHVHVGNSNVPDSARGDQMQRGGGGDGDDGDHAGDAANRFIIYGAKRPRPQDAFRLIQASKEAVAAVYYMWSLAPTMRRYGSLCRALKRKAGRGNNEDNSSDDSDNDRDHNRRSGSRTDNRVSSAGSNRGNGNGNGNNRQSSAGSVRRNDSAGRVSPAMAAANPGMRGGVRGGAADLPPLMRGKSNAGQLQQRLAEMPRNQLIQGISQAVMALGRYLIGIEDTTLDILTLPTETRAQSLRQDVCRTFGIIEELISILTGITATQELQNLRETDNKLYRLVRMAYFTFSLMVQSNPQNATTASKNVPLYLTHLGYDILAEEFVSMLITGNETLLKTIVNDSLVKLFLRLLRQQNMNPKFLRFLSNMSICNNEAVFQNQTSICNHFTSQRDLLILCRLDDSMSSGGLVFTWTDLRKQNVVLPFTEATTNLTAAWVIPYFCEQLALLSSLVRDRNTIVAERIAPLFPFTLIANILLLETIPPVMKSRFVELAMHLHVIRGDAFEVQAPRLVREFGDDSSDLPLAHPPERNREEVLDCNDKLRQFVKGYILKIHDVIDPRNFQENQLTCAVLELQLVLLRFGFYSSLADIRQLLAPLFPLLDPRSDEPTDGCTDAEVELVARLKSTIIKIFTFSGKLRLDTRVSRVIADLRNGSFRKSLKNGSLGAQILDKSIGLAVNALAALNPFSKRNQVGDLDANANKNTDPVAAAMQSASITFFENFKKVKPEMDLCVEFPDLAEVFRLLLDDFDSGDFLQSTLLLVDSEFQQNRILKETIENVQLLVDDRMLQVFHELIPLRHRLKILVNNQGLWATDAMCAQNADQFLAVLNAISQVCNLPTFTDLQLGNRTVNREIQTLLLNMGINEVLLRFLGMSFFPNLISTFNASLSVVGIISYGNHVVQKEIFSHLDKFHELSRQGVRVSHVLSAIFRENIGLVSRIPNSEIRRFVNVIIKEGCTSESLSVLKALVSVNGQVIRKNQSVVLNSLLYRKDEVLHIFSGADGREARNQLLRRDPNHDRITYYITVLELLSACCQGLNYLSETMCQPLIPFDDILNDIMNPRLPRRIVRAMAHYLNEVFLDTETPISWIPENNLLPLSISTLAGYVAELTVEIKTAKDSHGSIETLRQSDLWLLVFDGAIPCITTYMRWIFPNTAHGMTVTAPNNRAMNNSSGDFASSSDNNGGGGGGGGRRNGGGNGGEQIEVSRIAEITVPFLRDLLEALEHVGTEHERTLLEISLQNSAEAGIVPNERGAGAVFSPDRQRDRYGSGIGRAGDLDTMDADDREEQDRKRVLANKAKKERERERKDHDAKGGKRGSKMGDSPSKEVSFEHGPPPGKAHGARGNKVAPEVHGSGAGGGGGGGEDAAEEVPDFETLIPKPENHLGMWEFIQQSLSRSAEADAIIEAEFLPFAQRLVSKPESCEAMMKKLIKDAVDGEKQSLECNIVLLRLCQRIALGASIDDRPAYQMLLDSAGLTELVLRKIAMHSNSASRSETFLDALYLTGYALCKGSNTRVQDHIQKLLNQSDFRFEFFQSIQNEIGFIVSALKLYRKIMSNAKVSKVDVQSLNEPLRHAELVLLFLQTTCEGHHKGMQLLFRGDEGSMSVVDEVNGLWIQITKTLYQPIVDLAKQAVATLIEFVQGPCLENQVAICTSKFSDATNMLMRKRFKHINPMDVGLIKSQNFLLLSSMIEGRSDKAIHDFFASSLDIEAVLKIMFAPPLDQVNKAQDRVTRQSFSLGFMAYMLLKTLSDHSPDVQAKFFSYGQQNDKGGFSIANVLGAVNPLKLLSAGKAIVGFARGGPREYENHHEMYADQVGSVEIFAMNNLHKIYFRKPDLSRHLTKKTKNTITWEVNRDTPHDKITDFLERADEVVEDMRHQQALSQSPIYGFLANHSEEFLDLSFLAAIVLNLIFLAAFQSNDDQAGNSPKDVELSETVKKAVIGIGWIQTICNLVVIILYSSRVSYPITMKRWTAMEISRKKKLTQEAKDAPWAPPPVIKDRSIILNLPLFLYCAVEAHVKDRMFIYYSLALVFSFLGNFVSYTFFAFHLLGIVPRVETLKNVIRSVTHKAGQLLMTGLLGLIMLYIWSMFSFANMRRFWRLDGREPLCETLSDCFGATLTYGLRSGGGIGDFINPADPSDKWFVGRVLVDVIFFFMINIIFLNIIFGIIIDTFADLREEKQAKEEDMNSRCFICNIERGDFEVHNIDMDEHQEKHHNMWNYLFYIAYVKEKDPQDLSGLESIVFERTQIASIDWIPLHKSMELQAAGKEAEAESDNESIEKNIDIEGLKKSIIDQKDEIASLKLDIKKILDEVAIITRKERPNRDNIQSSKFD